MALIKNKTIKNTEKISSVRKVAAKEEKKETDYIPVSFVGSRMKAWFYCDTCETEKTHNVWKEGYDCLYCGSKTVFGETNINNLIQFLLLL